MAEQSVAHLLIDVNGVVSVLPICVVRVAAGCEHVLEKVALLGRFLFFIKGIRFFAFDD
jgi:hypothetical protein